MFQRPDLRRTSIAAISALALWTAPARAQNAEAQALFNDGDKLMKDNKVSAACDSFEASNRIEPRAGTLIRLGECREQNHEIASAWSAYKDALNRVKDPAKKAIASAKVAELEPRLSYVTVHVTDAKTAGLSITRNGQPFDSALWNRAIPINGGSYAFAAQSPQHTPWQTTVTVPAESGQVTVEVPVLEPANGGATLVTAAPPAPMVEGPSESPWTGRRKVAVVAVGVAVLAVAGGAVFGAQAKGKQHDADGLCPDPQTPCADATAAQDLIDKAHDRALAANVAFGVGAVAVIAGGILWFTGAPERAHGVAIVPALDHGSTTLAIMGRF